MLQALLFLAAVVLAVLHGLGVGGTVDLGWLALAFLFAALGLPAMDAAFT